MKQRSKKKILLIQCVTCQFIVIACEILWKLFFNSTPNLCPCMYKCQVQIFWIPTTFHRSLTMQFGGRMSCCSAVPFMLALSCRAGARHCNPESTLAAPSLNEPFICEKPPKCVKLPIHSYCHLADVLLVSWAGFYMQLPVKLQQTVIFQRLALECLI